MVDLGVRKYGAKAIVPHPTEYSSGMIVRRQLPAWSPLTVRALGAGVIPSGAALDRVERGINDAYQASGVILTASGTIALAIGFLASAPAGQRPRIGLPGWGCYDLMTAADAVDAEVLLYDLDPPSLAPDADSFARILSRKPHAVVVAHWFGIPVDLRPLTAAAGSAGVLLIDDAAQGVGASISGRPVGMGGDFGVLSFGRGKGRTGGGGGAVFGSTPDAAKRLRDVAAKLAPPNPSLPSYAALWAQWMFGRPGCYWLPAGWPWLPLGETVYQSPPELRRMSRRSAAVLDALWDLSVAEAEIRRANALGWQRRLGGAAAVTQIVTPEDGIPGWLRFPILASEAVAPRLRARRARRYGIMPGYSTILADLSVVAGRVRPTGEKLPGARRLADQLFTLPSHSKLRQRDIAGVGEILG